MVVLRTPNSCNIVVSIIHPYSLHINWCTLIKFVTQNNIWTSEDMCRNFKSNIILVESITHHLEITQLFTFEMCVNMEEWLYCTQNSGDIMVSVIHPYS